MESEDTIGKEENKAVTPSFFIGLYERSITKILRFFRGWRESTKDETSLLVKQLSPNRSWTFSILSFLFRKWFFK